MPKDRKDDFKKEFKVSKENLAKKIKKRVGEDVSNVRFVEGPMKDIFVFNYKDGSEGKGLYRVFGKSNASGDLVINVNFSLLY